LQSNVKSFRKNENWTQFVTITCNAVT
jgi:hypothetical protein